MKTQLIPEHLWSPSELDKLRNRLDKFYNGVNDYTAFLTPSNQDHCWSHVATELRRRLSISQQPKINVLEVGAGKSGFGLWLGQQGLRQSVNWSAQDVTEQNAAWLKDQADDYILGDVSCIQGQACFDVIFSTYVLEHVTEPLAHLARLFALLRPGGSLFIFTPRYDIPGYFCPSSRHLNSIQRFYLLTQLLRYRLMSFIQKRPVFLIQSDLAAFYGPFFTDADAVHWVSLYDLKYWAHELGANLQEVKVGAPKFGSKDWVVKRWLTCAVEIRKGL